MRAMGAVICVVLLGALVASGGHAKALLSSGVTCGSGSCRAALSGGAFELQLQEVEMRCRSVIGSGHFDSPNSGLMRVGFLGCREQATPFGMSCVGNDASGDEIETNVMGTTTVNEHGSPGVLLNSAELSFTCGGGGFVHIEGFFVGEVSHRACGGAARQYGLHMTLIAHGHEGTSPEAANYDVYIDGRGGVEYDFETPWRLRFDRVAELHC